MFNKSFKNNFLPVLPQDIFELQVTYLDLYILLIQ